MKKILFLALTVLLFGGCIRYSSGETTGYIYAVDGAISDWNQIWFKTSLESSESDCYIADDENGDLMDSIREVSASQDKVKISYSRHFATISGCGDDEIVKVEKVEK